MTTENSTEQPTINFNNKTYLINALPQEVQEFITIHQAWVAELVTQRREVFKLEAAQRGLLSELEARFKAIDAAAAAVAVPQDTSGSTNESIAS